MDKFLYLKKKNKQTKQRKAFNYVELHVIDEKREIGMLQCRKREKAGESSSGAGENAKITSDIIIHV